MSALGIEDPYLIGDLLDVRENLQTEPVLEYSRSQGTMNQSGQSDLQHIEQSKLVESSNQLGYLISEKLANIQFIKVIS